MKLKREFETITLLNGTQLKCFPKKSAKEVQPINNSLQIDMTGEYFQLGGKRYKKSKKCVPVEERPEVQTFLKNAHYLFERCDDILGDSRLFLSPIPFCNELAYFGISGFRSPTLGVYIEWWGTCQDVRLLDESGEKWLVCQLSGSPQTHCNSCLLVNAEGKTIRLHIGKSFMDVCRKFIRINQRCDGAKLKYEAYSLEKVLRMLEKKDRKRDLIRRLKKKKKKWLPRRLNLNDFS